MNGCSPATESALAWPTHISPRPGQPPPRVPGLAEAGRPSLTVPKPPRAACSEGAPRRMCLGRWDKPCPGPLASSPRSPDVLTSQLACTLSLMSPMARPGCHPDCRASAPHSRQHSLGAPATDGPVFTHHLPRAVTLDLLYCVPSGILPAGTGTLSPDTQHPLLPSLPFYVQAPCRSPACHLFCPSSSGGTQRVTNHAPFRKNLVPSCQGAARSTSPQEAQGRGPGHTH